jgi:hypothetical protein
VHDEKQPQQRISTSLGIQIEYSDEQLEKASDSNAQRREGVSKMTSRRERQDQKHFEPTNSTQFGIEIDESNPQSWNASDSIRQSCDGASNLTS